MTKISHSASNKYKGCPAQYKLHYIDRIRSHQLGSALLFGSALDEALNVLLETKLDNPPETATSDLVRIKQGFDIHMTYKIINKEQEDVRTSHFIEYFKSDFDPDILLEEDWTTLKRFISDAGYETDGQVPEPLELYKEFSEVLRTEKLDNTDLSFYNYASWLSLRRKGHLMLEHYVDEIMPQIKRVTSIQRAVELPNGEGDILQGYIDFEGELEGHEGVITIDNKTSTPKYKLSDINTKGQLGIYDEYTGNGKGAYIVLLKKVKFIVTVKCDTCGEESTRKLKNCPAKKCKGKMEQVSKIPQIESQILVDDIDEEKKDLLFDDLCGILSGIENKEFEQNRDSCFQFGRKCIYYDYCRSSPSEPNTKGLARV